MYSKLVSGPLSYAKYDKLRYGGVRTYVK